MVALYTFSSPEPVVSWSRGLETRLQIKPSGSGDENALYKARICEFFVERLWSGLWSGSFSVFRLYKRFLEQQSYMQCAFSCILFLSIIFQSVRVVTFVQDANHEQQLVSYVFSGYRVFAFF